MYCVSDWPYWAAMLLPMPAAGEVEAVPLAELLAAIEVLLLVSAARVVAAAGLTAGETAFSEPSTV